MYLRKIILLLSLSFLVSQNGYAQKIVADSLSKQGQELVEKQIEKNISDKLFWVWVVTGIGLTSLTGYAIYLAAFRLKKIADEAIKAKAEKLVEEAIQKATGVKLEVLQKFFYEQQKQQEIISSTSVAVLSHSGKSTILDDALANSGFKPKDYITVDTLPEKFDVTKCDVLLLDNTDDFFKEKEVVTFLEKHVGKIKLVYLANTDLSPEYFQKFRNSVKIVKLIDRLGEAIKQARS